jgi:rhodanese-related sulfurtransferase
MDYCIVPRWQLLKQTLNNLSYPDFLEMSGQGESSVIIDARTKEEYDTGHLAGAVNVDYLSPDLPDLLERLDPAKKYFVYCKTSRRSIRICVMLRNIGFKNLYNLGEGLTEEVEDMVF